MHIALYLEYDVMDDRIALVWPLIRNSYEPVARALKTTPKARPPLQIPLQKVRAQSRGSSSMPEGASALGAKLRMPKEYV